MPEIHPSDVVSFSSEDKEYPASNLLTPTAFKKWQCERAGEKSAVVEFQLPKAERISQVDIGNAGSAFIEVLVRRSSGADGDYQCLLVSSSFMSPLDARARTGLNRVRIFKADKLSRLVQEQKWDRVKVVCSQPFTRTEQYGLAFIRFYSTETASAEAEEKPKVKKQGTLGGFVIRDKGSDDEEEVGTSSGLFKKAMDEKKAKEDDSGEEEAEPKATPSNVATQIRAASKAAESERKKTKDEAAAADSPAATPPARKRSSEEDDEAGGSSRPTPKRHKKDVPNEKAKNGEPKRADKPRPKKDSDDSDDGDASTSLSSIMRGVEFVLSGYQNPLRARLRDMATGMGAKYRANWGRGCTHLICAFVATPKYKEVSGKGRIVTDKWILDSHKRRKLLPWRNYRLGRAPTPPGSEDEESPRKRRRPPPRAMRESDDEDEDEEDDEDEEVMPARKRRAPPARRAAADDDDDDDDWKGSSDEDSEAEMRKRKRERLKKKRGGDSEDEWKPGRKDRDEESDSEPDADIDEDESDEEEDDDEEEVMPKKKDRSKAPPARAESPKKAAPGKKVTKRAVDLSDSEEEEKPKPAPKKETASPAPKKKKAALALDSGSDSDGGWAPIRRKKADSSSPEKTKNSSPSKAAAKKDEEEEEEEDESRADLPTFFDSSFFMYGKFDGGLQRAVRRIIVAYGGKLEAYMTDSVKYVVTVSDWDDNFDDALMNNSSLIFVRPQWLLECDQKRRFVPYQKFQVVG